MSFDEDPNMEPTAQCRQCGQCGEVKQMSDKSLTKWQMQHLHFGNLTIDFLTCENCKQLSPEIFLQTLRSEE